MALPAPHLSAPPLELWGGVECTLNRVGDQTFDQFDRNGHATRLDDLDRFASLGIRTLRTSVLWERVAPDGLDRADWSWTDACLERMRQLQTGPVVGFVHHGSGPRTTSLVDPAFADGLAAFARAFARAFAERHPDVGAYTPVNEPLTTARFSGLYGHWYPHGRCGQTFARALVTQVQGIVGAMAAVRAVNPAAWLVQTEDLGRTWSTAALARHAAFENERRWLTWDLLCGRVDRHHPMWLHLVGWGIAERELDAFVDGPCPPDIVGVNHYVTSERFLDDRDARCDGRYEDVEAVRAVENGPAGLASLLVEASGRYGLPVAVTEAHLGCTREEQVRWLADVWRSAEAAQTAGAAVRAVTVWALLGSLDWDSLLTECRGHYEPGVFDVRSAPPRPTAPAGLVRSLAAGRMPAHPVLDSPGWWRRPVRFARPPADALSEPRAAPLSVPAVVGGHRRPRPLLVLGSDLPLGDAVVRLCVVRGLAFEALPSADALEEVLARAAPWAVVDALTGGAGPLGAEPPAVDAEAAGHRAALVAEARASLLTFSSDAVFAPRDTPHVEAYGPTATRPHGTTQAAADHAVQAAHAGALVVRTAPWISPWGRADRFRRALNALAQGRPVQSGAVTGSAVYLPDAVHVALDLLIDGECGMWHVAMAGGGAAAGLLQAAARRAGLDEELVARGAPGPHVTLASTRGALLGSAEEALGHFFSRDTGWVTPVSARVPMTAR